MQLAKTQASHREATSWSHAAIRGGARTQQLAGEGGWQGRAAEELAPRGACQRRRDCSWHSGDGRGGGVVDSNHKHLVTGHQSDEALLPPFRDIEHLATGVASTTSAHLISLVMLLYITVKTQGKEQYKISSATEIAAPKR